VQAVFEAEAESAPIKGDKSAKKRPAAESPAAAASDAAEKIAALYEVIESWQKAEAGSEYQVGKLLEGVKTGGRSGSRGRSRVKQPAKETGKEGKPLRPKK